MTVRRTPFDERESVLRGAFAPDPDECRVDPPGIVVGRGTDADLRINDPGVSRRHAEFRVHANESLGTTVSVVDLGSTNGMLVNGSRVQQATLSDGSSVKIGNTTMTIRFVPHETGGDSV